MVAAVAVAGNLFIRPTSNMRTLLFAWVDERNPYHQAKAREFARCESSRGIVVL